ncbi:MAG: DNA polymerase III subunit delta [Cyanobacteria bacterium P01_A01_bin.105]
MAIYFFWGTDEFRLKQAVDALCDRVLDATWASFNFDKIPPDQPDAVFQALNQAMTPPFGQGQRLVWLQNTTVGQRCPEALLTELQRTLPAVPDTTVLLLTSGQKPDGRLKSTKLLNKHAEVREFAAIAPWKTDQIVEQIYRVAQDLGLRLRRPAAELLAEAIGADTRRLYNELAKLKLYWDNDTEPLPADAVIALVTTHTQTSLQLAGALRQGQADRALELVHGLLRRNEPALRIVATLVGQFRTWLWVKLMVEAGERDNRAIAQAADVGNPKRVFFLQKEVRNLTAHQLKQAMGHLLSLEAALKLGTPDSIALPTKIIEIARCFTLTDGLT